MCIGEREELEIREEAGLCVDYFEEIINSVYSILIDMENEQVISHEDSKDFQDQLLQILNKDM